MKLQQFGTRLVLFFAIFTFSLSHGQDVVAPVAPVVPVAPEGVRPQPQSEPEQGNDGGVRQRPAQGGPGIGGLLSGLLGQITQTADVSECPGKCIHALASLICDEVRADIQCPSRSMRCCVERERPNRPNRRPIRPQSDADDSSATKVEDTSAPETTTKKRIKKKKPTQRPSTTARAPTVPIQSNSKVDDEDNFSYTDSSSNDPSRFYPGSTDYPRFYPKTRTPQLNGSSRTNHSFHLLFYFFLPSLSLLTTRRRCLA